MTEEKQIIEDMAKVIERTEQIEEMFNDVVEAEQRYHEYCLANICHACEYYGDGECDNHIRAEYLYNAGYRKQSEGEWINITRIHERLGIEVPQRWKCSCCDYLEYHSPTKYCGGCGAKMKGGAI